ncbi:nucleotide exchange factor GrpE [Frankia sp. CcI49]|uniref:nucleotide exchange factor GrpE n=1 Tax=unclassified Frankia TaxID=2632575 RepID=UPI0006CA13E2|nr:MULTISPECIES: nucleotide exchange factor GrpE [unclassified Frankia]KPM53020.1 molecular chaperone GrpE [Frankia sp. R43]ONH58471.1 nucleotide exchange factor GrpE [Frankia sp. CcI49]
MTPSHDEHRLDHSRAGGDGGPEEPIVKDRRRIDPETGQVRAGAGQAAAGAEPAGPASAGVAGVGVGDTELVASLHEQLGERTADLQRLKAEFDNYRRRATREREAAGDQAVSKLLTALLGVLDDIGRARDHGDLEGPFKAIAESLEAALESTGLERFGAPGEAFDPHLHHALLHSYRSDVSETTCVEIFRAGYRRGNTVLRAAQVAVAEPSDEGGAAGADVDGSGYEGGSVQAGDTGSTGTRADEGQPVPGASPGREHASVPDDTGSIPGPDRGGPTVSAD